MIDGSWYWCKAHEVVEFVSPRDMGLNHYRLGPYPTFELAEEFGPKVWGFDAVEAM